jgi:hypothetical protein
MGRNNQTNGIFDISKEADIVANIVVNDLMGIEIIKKDVDDRAVAIVTEQFLAFRNNRRNISDGEIVIKIESDNLAEIAVSALIDAGIIRRTDRSRAFEVAAEEILVRRSMENL